MRNARLHSSTAALIAALAVGLWTGCATSDQPQTEKLSPDEHRVLYPRQHLDSLDPWERRDAERQLLQDDFSRKR